MFLKSEIRRILETDRFWSIYALGDLDAHLFERCQWYAADGEAPALVLLYRGFDPPVLFAIGGREQVESILDEIDLPREVYLHIPTDIVPSIETRCLLRRETTLWRMALTGSFFSPGESNGAVRLGAEDLPVLRRLYCDGDSVAETPDFFEDAMVERGVFFGVREGDELIAVAGTHLVSKSESVAGIGNVYTRRDRRRRGLATMTTAAVTGELLRMGVGTIGLNVDQRNAGAMRVYERMGFSRYRPFFEGIAVPK